MYLKYHVFLKPLLCFIATIGIAASVSAEGILTVKTDPEGIEVWLGDKFLGQAPIIDKKVRAGRSILKLVDPAQHSSTTEELFIQDGVPTVVERTITGKFGSLRVNSTPDGADVYIATELGKTPLSNDFINPGKYRIEIRATGSRYKTSVTEVTIPKGETVTIDKKLDKGNLFSVRNMISFALLAGAAGGFTWGIIEQGHYRMYQERLKTTATVDKPALQDKIDGASLGRTLGLVLGSTCLLGLEIVILF